MAAGQRFKSISTLFSLIAADLKFYQLSMPKAWFVTEFRATLSFRIYSTIYVNFSKAIGFLWYEHSKRKYSMDIAPTAKIGPGMIIVHIGSIVIGRHAVIGENTKIQSGVTLGMKDENGAMPVVGNNCYLGTGSKILGAIKIGDDSIIGANSVVIFDIPANSTVVGIPGRVLQKK